mgnify:CR=1 FL=1
MADCRWITAPIVALSASSLDIDRARGLAAGAGPMAVQFVVFATFSIIVKYAEQLAFGTWDLDHFFGVFEGNFAYVLAEDREAFRELVKRHLPAPRR